MLSVLKAGLEDIFCAVLLDFPKIPTKICIETAVNINLIYFKPVHIFWKTCTDLLKYLSIYFEIPVQICEVEKTGGVTRVKTEGTKK